MSCSYEDLLKEYENELDITERPMRNDGLYADGCVWINSKMPESRKVSILAEEIGHHETSSGDILNLDNMDNARQEQRARKWAYKKLIPFEDVLRAVSAGCTRVWEFAEYLNVDEAFVKECFECYGLL